MFLLIANTYVVHPLCGVLLQALCTCKVIEPL